MHRIAASLTVLAVVAVLMIPLSAGGQMLEPKRSARAAAPWQEKNPYAGIFVTPNQQKPDLQKKAPPAVRTLPGQAATAPPRVVCGMTLIPVKPDVDSKMLIEPRGGDVDYKVRSMTTPMCR